WCVRIAHPSPRRACGTRWRPKLRSRKNSGSDRDRHAEYVLDVLWRNTEVLRDLDKWLAGVPAGEHGLDSHAAVNKDRLSERALGIGNNQHSGRCWRDEPGSPAIATVLDPLQVVLDNGSKYALARDDLGETVQLRVVLRAGVVVEDAGTIAVQ